MSHGNWNFEMDAHCTESTVSAVKALTEKRVNGYTVESKTTEYGTVNNANVNVEVKEN